jgi:hypothetical protein
MTTQLSDFHRAKRGMAALIACVVETMNEADPSFKGRFLVNLDKAYYKFRDDTDGDVSEELTFLSWARECLTGFNMVTGHGKPFLAD